MKDKEGGRRRRQKGRSDGDADPTPKRERAGGGLGRKSFRLKCSSEIVLARLMGKPEQILSFRAVLCWAGMVQQKLSLPLGAHSLSLKVMADSEMQLWRLSTNYTSCNRFS